jgi:hypothetical protein
MKKPKSRRKKCSECHNEYDALRRVADAALAIYTELGTRLSPAAFDELSETAKTALHDSLSNLKTIQSKRR